MSYKHVKTFRQRQKEKIIYVMGGKCACCGYDKCRQALELHHLDSTKKDFELSKNANKAWKYIIAELPKTILLCSNCHREVHAGLITNDSLKSSFNYNKAQEILDNIKKKKENKCNHCGKLITKGATYCSSCLHTFSRKVKRPTRDNLKQDIRTMPMICIAKKYGVSDNAIRKWCIYYNLPSKSFVIRKITDDDWEKL